MKRLNIVVPYRAREAHLKIFVQMVRVYFARDKVDRDIPYQVLVVEQEHGLPACSIGEKFLRGLSSSVRRPGIS